MTKRFLAVLLLLSVFAGAAPAMGTVYYVSTTGNDTNDGLSGGTPFLTIAKGVSVAVAGDTVSIAAGTYGETLVMNTASVALVGAGYLTTIIDPPGDSTAVNQAIQAGGSDLWFEGLTVRDAMTGIFASTASNYTLKDCRFQSCFDYGISFSGGSSYQIVDCRFENNGIYGAQLTSGSGISVITSQFSGHTGPSAAGLYISSTFGFTLRGNRCTGNTYGLYVTSGSDQAVISQNTFDANDTGVYIFPMSTPLYDVTRNNFWANAACNFQQPDMMGDLHPTGCWWGTTDTAQIAAKIFTVSDFTVYWTPFRSTWVDTNLTADTVAPAAPAIVAVGRPGSGQLTISWTKPSVNEDGSALIDLAGYKVYRWTAADTPTDVFPAYTTIADPNDTDLAESGLADNTYYHYLVTAYDGHSPWANESPFSGALDTGPSAPPSAVANAGEDDTVGYVGQFLALNGAACSDPTGDALTFWWSQVSGTSLSMVNQDFQTTDVEMVMADTYVLMLTVTDSWGAQASDTFTAVAYSATGPSCTAGAVVINGDDSSTRLRYVVLALSSDSTAAWMRVGEDPAFTGVTWQPFSNALGYTLADSDGVATVYAQFANPGYAAGAVGSDTIVLDRTGPLTPAVSFPDGATTTATPAVSLYFAIGEPTADVQLRYSEYAGMGTLPWLAWRDADSFSLSPYGETHTVFAEFRDAAGNTSIDSAVIVYSGAPPFPVRDFAAVALDNRYVRLTWSPSPSANRDTVAIYCDYKAGTVDYTNPVVVLASDSCVWETGPFAIADIGSEYRFGIRVSDTPAMSQEQNTGVVAVVEIRATSFGINPTIPNLSGKVISGSRFLLPAELNVADPSGYTVTFDSRAAGTLLFSEIPAVTATEPNPDGSYPFFIYWDTTKVPDGDYDLRVTVNAGVFRSEPIRVTVANAGANPDYASGLTDGSFLELSQRLFSGDTGTVLLGDSGSFYQVTFPPGALGENTAVRLTIGDTTSALNALDGLAYDTVGTVLDIALDNDQTLLGDTISISIPYADANNDSVVDGTRIRLALLRILYYNGSAWAVVSPENTWFDAALKLIWFRTNHFSKFAPAKEDLGGDLGASSSSDAPDGDVDLDDARAFSATYGSQTGDGNFNPEADIVVTGNSSGRIDFEDLGQFGTNYGQ